MDAIICISTNRDPLMREFVPSEFEGELPKGSVLYHDKEEFVTLCVEHSSFWPVSRKHWAAIKTFIQGSKVPVVPSINFGVGPQVQYDLDTFMSIVNHGIAGL